MIINTLVIISLIYLIGISLLLLFNEINYRWFHIKGEYTRKMAHVLATLATLPFPYLFTSHWYVLVLALLFFGILWFTQGSKHLNSIHDISRMSYGSYLLPVAIYLTFLIYTFVGDPLFYVLPISILAICDPVAAMAGMSIKHYNSTITLPGQRSKKTIVGSASFLLSSFVICICVIYRYRIQEMNSALLIAFLIAIIGTFAELFSWRGSDNLTIPLGVQLGLLWLI